jgi:hypothetical protein
MARTWATSRRSWRSTRSTPWTRDTRAKAAELEAAPAARCGWSRASAKQGVTELLREAYALVRQRKGEAPPRRRARGWAP